MKRLLVGEFTRIYKVTLKEARNSGLIEWDFNVSPEFRYILGYSTSRGINCVIEKVTHSIKFKLVRPARAFQEKNVQIHRIPLEVYSKREINPIIYF